MTEVSKTLNGLISVLIDGQKFYEQARDKVEDPALKSFFLDMARIRTAAISELKPYVRAEGEEVEDDGTFSGAARRFYTETVALVNDTDRTFIGQLEEHEDRVLEAFDDARENVSDPAVAAALLAQRAKFDTTHQMMRNLKKAA